MADYKKGDAVWVTYPISATVLPRQGKRATVREIDAVNNTVGVHYDDGHYPHTLFYGRHYLAHVDPVELLVEAWTGEPVDGMTPDKE